MSLVFGVAEWSLVSRSQTLTHVHKSLAMQDHPALHVGPAQVLSPCLFARLDDLTELMDTSTVVFTCRTEQHEFSNQFELDTPIVMSLTSR